MLYIAIRDPQARVRHQTSSSEPSNKNHAEKRAVFGIHTSQNTGFSTDKHFLHFFKLDREKHPDCIYQQILENPCSVLH